MGKTLTIHCIDTLLLLSIIVNAAKEVRRGARLYTLESLAVGEITLVIHSGEVNQSGPCHMHEPGIASYKTGLLHNARVPILFLSCPLGRVDRVDTYYHQSYKQDRS